MASVAPTVAPIDERKTIRREGIPSFLLVAALLLAHQIVLTLILNFVGPAVGLGTHGTALIVGTITGAAVVILAIVALDLRKPGRARAVLVTLPDWSLRTGGVMLAGIVVAQLPLLYLAVTGGTVWQSGAPSDLAVGQALRASLAGGGGLALVVATVLVAPVVEELLYRGYLVGAITARAPAPVAVIVSAICFVPLHMEAANLVAAFCLGLGTAICAVRTRSIFPGLIVHIASNGFGMWYATLS